MRKLNILWFVPLVAFVALAGMGCERQAETAQADPHAGHNHGSGEGHGHDPHGSDVGPETSGVKIDMSKGWCNGHGVPESVCTRCDESLIPQFKAAGDWCAGHNLPESQCFKCNPQAKAKWAALNPNKAQSAETPQAGGMSEQPIDPQHPETSRRLLTGRNEPECEVENMQVRFADDTIATKAGIVVEPADVRRISAAIEAPAEVEFNGWQLVRVTPRARGVVAEVRTEVGATVEAGEVLAVIESPELGEAKSRYLELRAAMELARTDLERAEAIYRGTQKLITAITATAPAGQREDLAQIVAGEAKGRLLTAHAELLLARSNYERAVQLKERGASSEQAYEVAVGALRKAEADFQATREAVAFESERARLAADKALKVARSALDVSARRLHILGLTDEEIEELGSGPDDRLSHYELRSPIAGQVIERRAVIGEAADEQDALYTVSNLSSLWLELNVAQRDAGLLELGQPVTFSSDGLTGQMFRGELIWISPQVDDRTRTVRARALLPNPDGRLRAKMFGTARISLHENNEVLSVPENAVQTDGCCQLVFVRESDTLFEPRKVVLGAAANGYVEILDGLVRGEPVVTTGSFLMKTEILKSNIGAGCCEVDPGR